MIRDVTRLGLWGGGLKPLNDEAAPQTQMESHQKAIYLYIIGLLQLASNVFFQAQIVSKSMAAGASPQTPLGEITALPRPPSCF